MQKINLHTLCGVLITLGFLPTLWAASQDYVVLFFILLTVQFIAFTLYLNQNSNI